MGGMRFSGPYNPQDRRPPRSHERNGPMRYPRHHGRSTATAPEDLTSQPPASRSRGRTEEHDSGSGAPIQRIQSQRRYTPSPAVREDTHEAGLQTYVYSRLPPLDPLPPAPTALPAEVQATLPEEVQRYLREMEALVAAHQKRDEARTLQLEALAFNPVLALRPNGEEEGSKELDPAPILGIRLLHQVQELTEENEELGRLLEQRLFPATVPTEDTSGTQEVEALQADLEDAHTLIQQLDAAVTAANDRTRTTEEALKSVCASNSVGIAESMAQLHLDPKSSVTLVSPTSNLNSSELKPSTDGTQVQPEARRSHFSQNIRSPRPHPPRSVSERSRGKASTPAPQQQGK